VGFDDKTGRFERTRAGEQRVLHHWEPNAAQQEEIERGLEVQLRGSRQKALRRQPDGSLSSAQAQAYDSARFVSFESVWSVAFDGDLPVFVVRDSLGGTQAAEGLDGVTRFEGESWRNPGLVLEGRYTRDDRQRGRFRLTRSGVPGVHAPRRPAEPTLRDAQALLTSEIGRRLIADESYERWPIPEAEDAAGREALQRALEADLSAGYRAQGNDPAAFAPRIRALADAMERLLVDERVPPREVAERLRRGELGS